MPEKGPATIRSPRTLALEHGTNPAGFEGQIDYCATCGHPLSVGISHSHYSSAASHIQPGIRPPQPHSPLKVGR